MHVFLLKIHRYCYCCCCHRCRQIPDLFSSTTSKINMYTTLLWNFVWFDWNKIIVYVKFMVCWIKPSLHVFLLKIHHYCYCYRHCQQTPDPFSGTTSKINTHTILLWICVLFDWNEIIVYIEFRVCWINDKLIQNIIN